MILHEVHIDKELTIKGEVDGKLIPFEDQKYVKAALAVDTFYKGEVHGMAAWLGASIQELKPDTIVAVNLEVEVVEQYLSMYKEWLDCTIVDGRNVTKVNTRMKYRRVLRIKAT